MTGRVQLALNVNDIDQAVAFYAKLFGTGPAKRAPRVCQLRRRRPAAEAGPAGKPRPGRQPQPPRRRGPRHRHRRGRAGTPGRGGPGVLRCRARPPAATPSRTSSGSRARPTARPGRSTPSWPTAPPSTPKATVRHAAAAPASAGEPASRPRRPLLLTGPQGCHAARNPCGRNEIMIIGALMWLSSALASPGLPPPAPCWRTASARWCWRPGIVRRDHGRATTTA